MTGERNWADNQTFAAQRVHRPGSVDELRRIVAGARHAHAIGARHSFNAVADTQGDLVDLGEIPPDFVIDPERRTATMGAGVDYGEAAAFLHSQGWGLLNTPSLPHVTMAGAAATGTHGSGDELGTLSSAVAGLQIVAATGDLVEARRGDADFDGMVVALGALGIVARITVDIQPTFDMRQEAFEGLTWDRLASDLDGVMSAGYSVSLVTPWSGPTVSRLWIKTRTTHPRSFDDIAADLGVARTANPLPADIAGLTQFGGVAGPWCDRLPHFQRDVEPGPLGHVQSEYFVPRERAKDAIALLRGIGARIDRHLLVTEIRSMLGDALWLSPAYGRPTIALHFSWQRELDAVAEITREIETLLLPLGGRPHWGKIMHSDHATLAPLYPRMGAFRDLRASFDPDGKFANDFLRAHVIGET